MLWHLKAKKVKQSSFLFASLQSPIFSAFLKSEELQGQPQKITRGHKFFVSSSNNQNLSSNTITKAKNQREFIATARDSQILYPAMKLLKRTLKLKALHA